MPIAPGRRFSFSAMACPEGGATAGATAAVAVLVADAAIKLLDLAKFSAK